MILLSQEAFSSVLGEQNAISQDNIAKQRIESERKEIIRQKEAEQNDNIAKFKNNNSLQDYEQSSLSSQSCIGISEFQLYGNKAVYGWVLKRKFLNPLKSKLLPKKPKKLYKLTSKSDPAPILQDLNQLKGDPANKTSQKVDQSDILANSRQCLTKQDLTKLYDDISNYYLKKGYVLARIYFDGQEISKGVLKIIIEEGRLEKLEFDDNSKLNEKLPFRKATQKFFAFPSMWRGDVVDLQDIEQGLEQINRLGSNNAKMSLDAGEKPGFSKIKIENQAGNQLNLSYGTDNSGNKSTGRIRRKIALNYDNFFGINDNLYFNFSESNGTRFFGTSRYFNDRIGTNDNSSNRFSKSFYGATSIPFGYWTFGGSYSYSSYLLTTKGLAATLKTSGNNYSKSYFAERVLLRGQKYKISLKSELNRNNSKSYIEDTFLPVNSRKTSEANFYLSNNFYFQGGNFFIQPKYSKGLSSFGAMKDKPNLAADKPRAQFDTFGIYAQTNLNFALPLPKLKSSKSSSGTGPEKSKIFSSKIPLNHKLTFDSLRSKNSLYGSDQFSLGGRYTVRGFQESVISGDNGYLIKNDLTARLSDLIPDSTLNSKIMNFGGKNFSANSAISKLRLGIFYDYGYVRNHIIDSANDEGYMSGAGASLSFLGKVVNWDLIYSKGLHSPSFLRNVDGIPKDNETIYFSLSFGLGLL